MIRKRIINPKRLRRIDGGFSFIPHRFITDGFLTFLTQKELLLYLFLVLVSDRHGLSFYSYDSICSLLQLTLDQYIEARNGLLEKDMISFDGTIFQVLDLPPKKTLAPSNPKLDWPHESGDQGKDPATIASLIRESLKEA
jgi:hypothetical protein